MIEDYYLYNRHVLEEARMRLKPVISDDDVYSRLIYGSVRDLSAKEKETPVYRNYDYIFKQIEYGFRCSRKIDQHITLVFIFSEFFYDR